MSTNSKIIHIHVPPALKSICDSMTQRKDNRYQIESIEWQPQVDVPALGQADLHVVFIDSADWMPEALATAITKSMDENPIACPVNRMLLFGFMDSPDARTHESTVICNKPMLKFLFQAFPIHYRCLPLRLKGSRKCIKNEITQVALSAGSETWERDWKRVYCAIQRRMTDEDGMSRFKVWSSFESLADADIRAREEHDAGKGDSSQVNNIDKLAAFQAEIDCYYLATARDCHAARKFIFIEDNPGVVRKDLQGLVCATGCTFYITRKPKLNDREPADCHDVVSYIESSEFDGRFLEDHFDRISNIPAKSVAASNKIENPAAFLVDLQLGRDKKDHEISGENVLRILHDKAPSIPAFVVTRSEEPDVLARCVKLRGADRVVPKRRLTRLPHALADYLYSDVSPLLRFFEDALVQRLVEAYRTWTAYPGILWHGEKTYHAAEHTLEHHLGLWKLMNDLLPAHWEERIRTARRDWVKKQKKEMLRNYKESDLFRFMMALWLHDIGIKGNERYQMADQVRGRHSWISGDLIRRNPEIYLLTRGEESEVVALLCEYHQSCAPFDSNPRNKCGRSVTGLFQQTLEEIEESSGWPLLEWAALLRLLDAMEHNWRRIGIRHLSQAKQIAIQIDRRFYLEKAAQDKDAEEYAKFLGDQQGHMEKHLAVMDVSIKTKLADDGKTIVFWPEYTFTDKEHAREFLPKIGMYVLKEWHATGEYIRDRMGMRLACAKDEIAQQGNGIYAMWDFEGYEDLEKGFKHAEEKLHKASDDDAKEQIGNTIIGLEKEVSAKWPVD